jgi:RHS repeat-associated protein
LGTALFTYGYDTAGNRTSETTGAGTTTYAYEADADRLARATGAAARTFSHDPYGSRTCDTAGGCPFSRFVYDDGNRLVRVQIPSNGATHATYTYDAFGRRVAKTSSIGMTTVFVYDPAGHVLEKVTVNPTGDDYAQTAVWLEDEPIGGVARTKEAGTTASLPAPVARFVPADPSDLVWLLGALGAAGLVLVWLPPARRPRAALVLFSAGLASQSIECVPPPAGAFFWIHTDHLGAPIAMSDTPAAASAAKIVWRAKYEPFGQAAVYTDPDGDGAQVFLDLRLLGQLFDSETGLHYNYFRTYDPRTGRYLEADPIGSPGAVLDLETSNWREIDGSGLMAGENRYEYSRSDPIRIVDPSGLSTVHARLMAAIATGNAAALRTLLGSGALSEEEAALAQRALERLSMTARQIISAECKGRINSVFPSEPYEKTLEEIMRLNRQGLDAARTALKLLNSNEYKK